MTDPYAFTLHLEMGTSSNLYHYVARKHPDGSEIDKVRVPLHLLSMDEPERRATLFRQLQADLSERLAKKGYRSWNLVRTKADEDSD